MLERNVEAAKNPKKKISKMLGMSGTCYGRTNVQAGDSKESTLPCQPRLKIKKTGCIQLISGLFGQINIKTYLFLRFGYVHHHTRIEYRYLYLERFPQIA